MGRIRAKCANDKVAGVVGRHSPRACLSLSVYVGRWVSKSKYRRSLGTVVLSEENTYFWEGLKDSSHGKRRSPNIHREWPTLRGIEGMILAVGHARARTLTIPGIIELEPRFRPKVRLFSRAAANRPTCTRLHSFSLTGVWEIRYGPAAKAIDLVLFQPGLTIDGFICRKGLCCVVTATSRA